MLWQPIKKWCGRISNLNNKQCSGNVYFVVILVILTEMHVLKYFIFFIFICSCKKNPLPDIPLCIQNKITVFESQPKDSRPYSVTEYFYKGDFVYYIISPCCDQYNPVYNRGCDYLGSPNGGIAGSGDGKLQDFFANATNKKLIWENK